MHRSVDVANIDSVSINDDGLTIAEVVAVARHKIKVVPFAGKKREITEKVREYVEQNWLSDSAAPQYGFNTGVGALKNVRIGQDEIKKFQELYVKSHCVGVGKPLPTELVRGAMLLQANALSRGHSGIRALIIDKLIEMLNKGIHPVVPEQGSLGASGDLAPLTHIASVLTGEEAAEIELVSRRVKLKDISDASGTVRFTENESNEVSFEPIQLHGKEAISLTNSTAVMLSFAAHLIHDTEVLLKNADITAALSLEAMMCESSAFAEDLHELRYQSGQITTARNIRSLIQNSQRMTPEARLAYFTATTAKQIEKNLSGSNKAARAEAVEQYKLEFEFDRNRIQDAYSLRCVPQVHGACKDTFHHVRNVVEREMQAVTDNPVILKNPQDGGYVARSGGNFHGEPLAQVLDFLGIALAEIGSISERRVFRTLSPTMSFGLPRNLTGGEPGLNSGYMLLQYTGAQLVSENKVLAHPASVDSIPTSDNQEDHVSMGLTAGRKAREVLINVQNLIAIELLCAVQAIELSADYEATSLSTFALGEGSNLAFRFVRDYAVDDEGTTVNPFRKMSDDEYLHQKVERMRDLLISGEIVESVAKHAEVSI